MVQILSDFSRATGLKKHPALYWGIGITVFFLIIAYTHTDFLEILERKLYDVRMELRGGTEDSDKIVIVDIDNESIEKIGRWPWPRFHIAAGIGKISAAGAKVIGLNIIYSEEEDSAAVKEIAYLAEDLKRFTPEETNGKILEIIESVNQIRSRLDNDRKLAEAITASDRVVLPVFFKQDDLLKPKAEEKRQKSVGLAGSSVKVKNPDNPDCPKADEIIMPIPRFFQAAKGIGHVTIAYDIDGKVRWEQLLHEYGGKYIPSFSLSLAALFLDVNNSEIEAVLGKSVSAGFLEIPLTPKSEFLVSFKGGSGTFRRYSFFDILNDKYQPDVFKNKIVIITPSAAGVLNPISTPGAAVMSVGEFTANAVWAMLNRKFVHKPSWDVFAGLMMILMVGGLLILVLPRLKAHVSAAAFVLLLAMFVGIPFYLFISHGIWIQIICPLLQLIFGYIGMVSIKYFLTETRKEKIEVESAETNRMLGLSFQSQGQLDMAFDKFRKVPMDNEMKATLYNLGLDFERKRQFNKAASVYEYVEEYDPKYKDVSTRKKKLMQASDTMVFGDGFLSVGTSGGGLISPGSDTRPTLGRYEIVKQLGKGAMGVVYLGKDPRINRTTAIKTFRFSEDFTPEEVKLMKEKFFREAESAGTLSHPNIVTIYDAGEEQELAYIAMEYLEGEDLQKYTRKGSMLPMRKVLDYIADIAEALDYAHEKGIVHRDIKPANIMLLKSGVVKITDFGIARITAASQTQTGVVKGTPHYMSPEQISGEKVDGRSDIFSLGSMLFQLLTGDVPFHGNSPAALLHQIINVVQPDPRTLNPKLLKPHVAIINKAMEKDREKRYQRANLMAAHLRALGKKIDDALGAAKK